MSTESYSYSFHIKCKASDLYTIHRTIIEMTDAVLDPPIKIAYSEQCDVRIIGYRIYGNGEGIEGCRERVKKGKRDMRRLARGKPRFEVHW